MSSFFESVAATSAWIAVDVSCKSLVLAGLVWISMFFLRNKDSAVQHRTCVFVLVSMLVMPGLVLLAPQWVIPVDIAPVMNTNHLVEVPLQPEVFHASAEARPLSTPPRPTAGTLTGQGVALGISASAATDDRGKPISSTITAATIETEPDVVSVRTRVTRNWAWIVAAAYLAGLTVLMVRILIGLVQCKLLLRRASLADLLGIANIPVGSSVVLESSELQVPVTLGLWRPRIVLPADWKDWTKTEVTMAVSHEAEHIRRRDTWISLLSATNCAIYWFHPLSWILAHRLSDLAEHACDDAVIAATGNRTDYATILVRMASKLSPNSSRYRPACVGMARKGAVEKRVLRIIDDRRPLSAQLGWWKATTLAISVLALAVFAAGISPTDNSARAAQPQEKTATGSSIGSSSHSKQPAIAGRVVAVDGSSAIGAEVRLLTTTPGRSKYTTKVCRSGADGTFQFAEISEGTHRIVAFLDDLSSGTERNPGMSVNPGEVDLVLTLQNASSSRGSVTDRATEEVATGEDLPVHAIATLGSNWLRHAEGVSALAFSPNGNYLASGGAGKYVKIWDLDGRRLAYQLAGETDYGHSSVAISPDGTNVAAITGDGLLRMWDASSRGLSWEQQLHEDSGISRVEFFSDGQRVASSGNGGVVVVTDVETGKTITTISCHSMNKKSRGVTFAIAPNDLSIALGSWCDIEIVPLNVPMQRKTLSGCHGAEIASLCYTPDGNGLLSCGASREKVTIKGQSVIRLSAERKLWSMRSGELVREFEANDPDGGIASGRVSVDGKVIVATNDSIDVWNLETGVCLKSIENRNTHAGWHQNGFAISSDSETIAAVEGTTVLFWDSKSGEQVLDENPAHSSSVTDVAFSGDSRWAASSGRSGDVRVWNRSTQTLSHVLIPAGRTPIQIDSVSFSPNSERILAAGTCYSGRKFSGTLSLWETVSGKVIKSKLLDGRASCAQFSSSGKEVFVGSGIAKIPFRSSDEPSPKIQLYDEGLTRPRTVPSSLVGRIIAVFGAVESNDFYFVEDNAMRLWYLDKKSSTLSHFQLEASRNRIKSAAFTSDGKVVATSGLFDEMIYLWETATGKQIASFNYGNSKGSMLAFSSDNQLLAIAPIGLTHTTRQYAKNIILWDTKNKLTVGELNVTMPNVSAIEFTPDGSELITGHNDGTLTLWQVPSPRASSR